MAEGLRSCFMGWLRVVLGLGFADELEKVAALILCYRPCLAIGFDCADGVGVACEPAQLHEVEVTFGLDVCGGDFVRRLLHGQK
jgi:hypothetical protein